VFQYVQDDARLWGAEGTLRLVLAKQWQLQSEYAMVRARNISRKEDLIGMPADRMRHSLLWKHDKNHIEAELSVEHVWMQSRYQEDVDYAPPPGQYTLVMAGAGMDVIADRLSVHFTARNLLNTAYREYLNRLRYYADDTGRSIEMRLRYVF
jgi:iron complex outermembrane receptor protein